MNKYIGVRSLSYDDHPRPFHMEVPHPEAGRANFLHGGASVCYIRIIQIGYLLQCTSSNKTKLLEKH